MKARTPTSVSVRGRMARALVIVLVACGGVAESACGAVLQANPSNFGSVFSGAAGGDVIELAAGDYGRFEGGDKPATVTIRPQAGAQATMSVSFARARNIRIEGLTIDGAGLSGTTRDIAIVDSTFTGQAVVQANSMVNANILFARDRFDGIDACDGCQEGRLTVTQYPRGNEPVGVTVRDSHFGGGGESDGVQVGAFGVVVGPGNVFEDIRQGNGRHVDAIQLYGQASTTIVGNFFRRNSVEIMAPDGGRNEVVTDNVFLHAGGAAIQFGGHVGTLFAHNTVRDLSVAASGSTDTVLRDNIMIDADLGADCSGCRTTNNLFTVRGDVRGDRALHATPSFVGGANPATYPGFELAGGSPGENVATDGSDLGPRFAAPAAGPPAPPPAAGGPGAGTRAPIVRVRTRRTVTFARLRRGLRVRVALREPSRLAFSLRRKGAKRLLRSSRRHAQRAGTHRYRVKPRSGRLGKPRRMNVILRLRVRTAAGDVASKRLKIRVRRR